MNFEQAMSVSGLIPRIIQADGKWRRCPTLDHPKKKNGAYVLYPDGRGYWRNWATDDGVNSWSDDSTTKAKPIDFSALRRQQQADRERRIRAIRSAHEFFGGLPSLRGQHPYIECKGLTTQGCSSIRIHEGRLVIPVMWEGRLISIQTIDPNGEKRFWPGAPVKAGSFSMTRPRASVTAICEGFATGLAIYQSVPMANVIVAFDAGNLAPVVEKIKPKGNVIICADNDHATERKIGINPGLTKAINAAGLIGAGVAFPQGIEGTDWADALKEIGEGAKRRIERQILAQSKYVAG